MHKSDRPCASRVVSPTHERPQLDPLLKAFLFGTPLSWGGLSLAQPVFRVTPIPNGSPADLARKAASLRQYLETHLGMKVDFAHGADNAAAAVRALVRREVHLAGLAG